MKTLMEAALEGLSTNFDNLYNSALEDAKKAVIAEYLKLKDLGRGHQFDIADITTPIDNLKLT